MKKASLWLLLAVLTLPLSAAAQSDVPKGEFGVSYEMFRPEHLAGPGGRIDWKSVSSGVSFRGTYNINRWAALETTFGISPAVKVKTVGGVPPVAGAEMNVWHNEWKIKATARSGDHDNLGIFAYGGPGWYRGDPNAQLEPQLTTFTEFSFEFGGGAEYYPHRNAGIRVEVGDLIVKMGPNAGTPEPTVNTFIFRVGASFRFR